MAVASLKIVLVYSDRSSAKLGARVSNSLRRRLGSDFQVAQSIWNAELLRSPKLRKLAAEEAKDSDLVIIATSEGVPLSGEVSQWFKLWSKRQREIPSALVALLKRQEQSAETHVVENRLHQFADRAHMDFFCHSETDPAEETFG